MLRCASNKLLSFFLNDGEDEIEFFCHYLMPEMTVTVLFKWGTKSSILVCRIHRRFESHGERSQRLFE